MAPRSVLIGLAALAAVLAAQIVRAAAEPVDLELVIATDASRSIDEEEARLQREGVASAFLSRDVVQAIRSGTHGKIAVAYIDWSSAPYNKVILDWRVISDEATANAFAQDLLNAGLTFGRRTSISSGIAMAAEMFDENGFKGTRRAIDVSGDGPNNSGPLVTLARDAAVARGIVINGLPIQNENDRLNGNFYLEDLDLYYEGCVIGGPGAFVVPARDFRDFARAIKKKLILEIAGLMPDGTTAPRQAAGNPLARVQQREYARGCDIGERMRARAWGGFDLP